MNANGILTVVFGWVPSFATSVWNWFNGKQDNGLFAWLADNWKGLVLTVAVIALVVDLVVYLIRWRPYRVWISFYRRLHQTARPSDPEVYWERRVPEPVPEPQMQFPQQEPVQPENYQPVQSFVPAEDPAYSVAPETAPYTPTYVPYTAPNPEEPTYAGEAWPQPDPGKVWAQPEQDQTHVPLVYREIPVEPTAWADEEADGYMDPAGYDEAEGYFDEAQPRVRRSSGKRVSGKNVVGGLFRSMTADDEEPPHIRYQAPQPAMDPEEAYHAPYIPPQWQDPGNAGAGAVRRRRSQL